MVPLVPNGITNGTIGKNLERYWYTIGRTMNARMDIQTAQSKRRRCNTGIDNSAFLSLSIDDKLAHICDKINNFLEESNGTLVNIAHSVNQNSVQVNQVNLRMNRHELLLKLLAYKSIDSDARSRRRNLVFHGLAEIKNEDCLYKLGEFLWEEMSIDIDDLYIERLHRLGSIQKARQGVTDPNEPVRRPIIVAFNDTRSLNRVLYNAHMLRGKNFSS